MYSFRVYDRALTEAEIVANNAVDAVRFLGKSYTNLVVGTDLVEAGPVSPDYGAYVGIKSGGVVDCTAPRDGKAKGCDYKCLGYTLYTNNAAGAWCDWKSNTTTSVVYQQPAGAVRLVWHWKRKPGFMLLLR